MARTNRIGEIGGGASSGVGRAASGKMTSSQVAKNSVKVVAPKGAKYNKDVNNTSASTAESMKTGVYSKMSEKNIKQSKPAKVVKINSAAKSSGTNKAANAKALKAANKGKKK